MALCVARLGRDRRRHRDLRAGRGARRAAAADRRADVGPLADEAWSSSLDHLHAVVRELGSTLAAPFMTLSFLALSVIPALKITDRGLVDVERFAIVPFDV